MGRGYYVAHSPDGIHWTPYPENPVLPNSDTCTLAYDAKTGEFPGVPQALLETPWCGSSARLPGDQPGHAELVGAGTGDGSRRDRRRADACRRWPE